MSRRVVAVLACSLFAGCGDDTEPVRVDDPPVEVEAFCQADDWALAERMIRAMLGRHPYGAAEVTAVRDSYRGLLARGATEREARDAMVDALARDPEYVFRWSDFFMDVLRVPRELVVRDKDYSDVPATSCYTAPRGPVDDGALAAFVRDHAPSEGGPPLANFTLAELLASSLELDDLSPSLRANLFHFLLFPFAGANLEGDDLERARRLDLGAEFSEVYLRRNLVCLECHNSQASVTFDVNPELNRAWPLPGRFEAAVFGTDSASQDPLVPFSVFRIDGVANDEGLAPWGWNAIKCRLFSPPTEIDPLGYDASFASVKSTADDPQRGMRASVWGLEASLHRGVDSLTAGLQRAEDGTVAPDQAFAYMVGASMASRVWNEVIGTDLVIANYFPRTEAQRDTLQVLTDRLVETHFSLRTLLKEIVASPAFNTASVDDWCSDDVYSMPRLLNPWTDAEIDPAARGNGAGDRIHAASSRTLLRGLHLALEWERPPAFPVEDDLAFGSAIGLFISNAAPGSRGLDFSGRLSWESRFGRCSSETPDFITRLAATAVERGAPLEQAIIALRDRLVGESLLDDAGERSALEGLVGPLNSVDPSQMEARLRTACGVYVASPQYFLEGGAARGDQPIPELTPSDHDYAASCAWMTGLFGEVGLDATAVCAAAPDDDPG